MHKDSITVDGAAVEIMSAGAQARTAQGKKPDAAKRSGGGGGDVPMLPRQAQRGRGKLGLGMRGRGGAGRGGASMTGRSAAAEAGPGAATATDATAGSTTKSQDDFRAMLLGKK